MRIGLHARLFLVERVMVLLVPRFGTRIDSIVHDCGFVLARVGVYVSCLRRRAFLWGRLVAMRWFFSKTNGVFNVTVNPMM